MAGQKAEELLDPRWSDAAPLTIANAAEVLRTAVAYSLANDEASLAGCASHFTPKMKGTPDANAFAVLSADIDQHGLAFRDAAAKIASMDTLPGLHEGLQQARNDAVANDPRSSSKAIFVISPRGPAPRTATPWQLQPGQRPRREFSQPGSPISQWPMPARILMGGAAP